MLSTCLAGCQAFPGIGRWRLAVIPASGMLVSVLKFQINTHRHHMFTKNHSKSAHNCCRKNCHRMVCYKIASLDHPPPSCRQPLHRCLVPAGGGHVRLWGSSQWCGLAMLVKRNVSTHATAMHQIRHNWSVAGCLWQALP